MSAPDPKKPQKRYFYSGRWSKGHDHAFVTALTWKAKEGKTMEHPYHPNEEALQFASDSVSTLYRWEFRPQTYAWHLERLRKRDPEWENLKLIFSMPVFNGVEWSNVHPAVAEESNGVSDEEDSDDGVEFLGTKFTQEPPPVVDLVSSDSEGN
ncbi:hypothetical protein Salat_2407600 [Sesamum alatum]|uniref:Uncharacterized protein n=1 Tax=Sesamum alatum TaxID=300844 RepID=A0AAE1XXU3_9LAMI|nr:hypothetical protein Salat_2407600 [Sesamum alatum]